MPRPLPPPPERRAFGRRETLIHAIVRIAGRPPEPCIVRNVSAHGALLELPSGLELPEQFRLVIEARGVDVQCQPRRRNGNQIGVEFCGEKHDSVGITDSAPGERRSLVHATPRSEAAPRSMPPSGSGNPILAAGPFVTIATGDEVRRQFGLTAP